MKNIKPAFTASLFVGVLVLSFLAMGFGPRGVSAESNAPSIPGKRSKSEKISDTLRERAAQHNDEIVQIILQLYATPTGRLNALLQRNGVRVKDEFKEFNSAVVELPSSVLPQLAEFDEVEFISLDREVSLLGHVEKTTGAAFMRTRQVTAASRARTSTLPCLIQGLTRTITRLEAESKRSLISPEKAELTMFLWPRHSRSRTRSRHGPCCEWRIHRRSS